MEPQPDLEATAKQPHSSDPEQTLSPEVVKVRTERRIIPQLPVVQGVLRRGEIQIRMEAQEQLVKLTEIPPPEVTEVIAPMEEL